MAQDWFVAHAGKESGPFTSQQLREMADSRKLAPDDLVRRADMKGPRKASAIKGLFPDVSSLAANAERSADESSPAVAPAQTEPRSFLAMFTSKKRVFGWSMGAVGLVVVLMCCGGMSIVGLLGDRLKNAVQTELAEADSQWDKGDKAGAADKYRKLIARSHFISDQARTRVYGRTIDGDYERGDAASGKALLEKARGEGVSPTVSHPGAKAAVAAIQAERERAEAKKKNEERLAKLAPQDRLKEAKWDDVVSAQSLYNDFRSNEVAASEQYGGKTIMIEGEVDTVERGSFGSSDKILIRGRTGYAVRCALSGGGDDLKHLQSGSWVRLEGRCDGKAPSGVVEMSRCIFVLVNR